MTIIPDRPKEIIRHPLSENSMVLYGVQGAGKTTLSNGDNNSVTVATEPGTRFLKTRYVDTYSWETFQEIVCESRNRLSKDPTFCSALVIDIVDNLFDLCRDHVCKNLGISYPGEKKDFGRAWVEVYKEWKCWIARVMTTPNARFITHERSSKITVQNQYGYKEEVEQKVPQFHSNTGAKYLDGICDMVGHCYVNKSGKYCVNFMPSSFTIAKDRSHILQDLGEIELPNESGGVNSFNFLSELYLEKAEEKGIKIQSKRITNVTK